MSATDSNPSLRGAAMALGAAAFFGAAAPLSKLLLGGSQPLPLAAFLYLGAGLGLSLARSLRSGPTGEARLQRADLPPLLGMALLGGVVGPVLMLVGLERLPAVTTALLLNLETPLTMLLAISFFGEHLGRGEATGAALVVMGAGLLGYRPGGWHGDWSGIAAIAGACLCWALDNNLTQRVSLRDPVSVARFKTMVAGSVSLTLAALTGQRLGTPTQIAAAALLGTVSYGLSLVLYTTALRLVGAARSAGYFAAAPFVGALLAVPLLGEHPTRLDALAAVAMMSGIAFFVRARHSHVHRHAPEEHDHVHVHDEHHRHEHAGSDTQPHSHPHRHDSLTHDHAHVSDAHHRHAHH